MNIKYTDLKCCVIKGVSLTQREAQIVSCIINGRHSKSIGLLLGISPHTVTTHIRNIMTKLGCSSQEQVIKLAELSESYLLIRDKYLDIVLENEFSKTLKEIAKITTNKNLKCEIHALDEIDPEVATLVNYFAISGISAKLSTN